MFFRLAAEICVTAAKTEWITDKAPKIYDGYWQIPVYRDKGASKLTATVRKASRKRDFSTKCSANAEREVSFGREVRFAREVCLRHDKRNT